MLSKRTVKYGTFAMLAANFAAAGALISHIEDQPQRDPEGLKPANVQIADNLKVDLDCNNWTPKTYDCDYDLSSLTQAGPIQVSPIQDIHAYPGQNKLSFVFTVLSKDHTQQSTVSGNFQTLGQDPRFPSLYPTAVSGGAYGISAPQPVAATAQAATPAKAATPTRLG